MLVYLEVEEKRSGHRLYGVYGSDTSNKLATHGTEQRSFHQFSESPMALDARDYQDSSLANDCQKIIKTTPKLFADDMLLQTIYKDQSKTSELL